MDVWQLQDSLADGGAATIFITEVETGNERYFLYDQNEGYITIGDFEQGVSVSANPDGTYDLWAFVGDEQDDFLTVDNGLEALKIVATYNEFTETSPYILLMAFSAALTPSDLEARMPTGGQGSGLPNVPGSMNADKPAVCSIFSEFCQCAACLVLDRKGACEPCPGL